MKKKIRIVLLTIAMILVMNVPVFADDLATANLALAQYYAAIVQQGGNEQLTAAQAQQLHDYHMALAASVNANPQTAAPAPSIVCSVVNVDSSPQFVAKETSRINSMPEYLKKRMNDHNVVFYLYKSYKSFGNDGRVANTCTNLYSQGSKLWIDSYIQLSENDWSDQTQTIYHEVGHVVNYIYYEMTGIKASDNPVFVACVDSELAALDKITNTSLKNYSEFFSEAFALYHLNPTKLQKHCPNVFAFIQGLSY